MEKFKIYIDRLKSGDRIKLDETVSADLLGLTEKELAFPEPVRIRGEVYIAEDHLISHLNIETMACIPCSICNQAVPIPIALRDLYLTKPLEEVHKAVYDLSEEIRESILLQAPLYAECNQGQCPERGSLEKFLAKPPEQKTKEAPPANHFPFADL